MNYQDINSKAVDKWIEEGWKWGEPVSHEVFERAKQGEWSVLLTPTKPVPKDWFPKNLNNCKILGLASGGGQQMPVFSALGAKCSVIDYSEQQIESERIVAKREGYEIEALRRDMTKPLPFDDESFDLVFHPVSNIFVENVEPIFCECFRILKKGGALLCGLDNGINYIVDCKEERVENSLPFNPLKNKEQYELLQKEDCGIQFSHTLSEQIGGQLKAGFILTDLYEDTNGEGRLHELNIPTFFATKAIKR